MMNWQIFLWPLKLPGVLLIVFYTLVGWFLLFLVDFYSAIEPITRWLTIGFSLPCWYLMTASLAA